MEFRKMLMITLYAEQKKETQMYRTVFWTLWERRGWDVSVEQHRYMYII